MTKFYRATLPEFGGYDHFGYGETPEQAVKACKKSYNQMRKWRGTDHSNPDYGTFKRACEYFGFSLVEEVAGKNAIEGNEKYLDYKLFI